MGEIIPSESLSRVTYTGINSMHPEKTKQPYIWSTRNNRTRKKKSEVEDLQGLEPVYDLFTIMGDIISSKSLSRVIYTGINRTHPEKTKQPYIRSTRNNRTRKKKSALEEDPRKSPENI